MNKKNKTRAANRIKRVRPLDLFLLGMMVGLVVSVGGSRAVADREDAGLAFQLSSHCPPGFQKVEGACELRSLYQIYSSLEDGGLGGTTTGLPPVRDGFSPQQIDLGRYLFFDPILSVDSTLACSSCHDPAHGFSDGRGRAEGYRGTALPRSAPSLWNVAFLESFFWDGRASSLEEQMEGPLYSEVEMANTKKHLAAAINSNTTYRRLFAEAFEREDAVIPVEEVYYALAAFESSLISLNSRYDRYAHGDADALTEEEIAGLNVFRSFVARCSECHTPPIFTNQQLAVLGTPEPEGMPRDVGAAEPLDDPAQRGAFKVPTLRNIELTAPYMHSGKFRTMKDAARFYTLGRGHAVPEDEEMTIHWHIWNPDLRDHELDLLVVFLKTLTDESFMPKIPEAVPSGYPVGGRPVSPDPDITNPSAG